MNTFHFVKWLVFHCDVQRTHWHEQLINLLLLICSPIMSVYGSAEGSEEVWTEREQYWLEAMIHISNQRRLWLYIDQNPTYSSLKFTPALKLGSSGRDTILNRFLSMKSVFTILGCHRALGVSRALRRLGSFSIFYSSLLLVQRKSTQRLSINGIGLCLQKSEMFWFIKGSLLNNYSYDW